MISEKTAADSSSRFTGSFACPTNGAQVNATQVNTTTNKIRIRNSFPMHNGCGNQVAKVGLPLCSVTAAILHRYLCSGSQHSNSAESTSSRHNFPRYIISLHSSQEFQHV